MLSDYLTNFGVPVEVSSDPNKVRRQMMAAKIKSSRLMKLFRRNRPGLLSNYNKKHS